MELKKIPLTEDEEVYLECYLADPIRELTRKALLVIPGGGYRDVCSDREGEPIVMAFQPYGYNGFVLHYSVGRKRPFPAQLIEVALAIRHIKENAEAYGIDPEEIFVVGFSAGGHLAASSGVLWKLPEVTRAAGIGYGENRPRGVMLIYPVISAEHHDISFHNLLCSDEPSQAELERCSVERHVDGDSSPAFLLHTANDPVVDVKNSLVLAQAYADAGVPFEMHIYPDGPHGVALGNRITRCGVEKYENAAIAQWVSHAVTWADSLGS